MGTGVIPHFVHRRSIYRAPPAAAAVNTIAFVGINGPIASSQIANPVHAVGDWTTNWAWRAGQNLPEYTYVTPTAGGWTEFVNDNPAGASLPRVLAAHRFASVLNSSGAGSFGTGPNFAFALAFRGLDPQQPIGQSAVDDGAATTTFGIPPMSDLAGTSSLLIWFIASGQTTSIVSGLPEALQGAASSGVAGGGGRLYYNSGFARGGFYLLPLLGATSFAGLTITTATSGSSVIRGVVEMRSRP
jgi:hypothetical protein